jgi:V/A-type H+-transporting ATPase subunit K
MKKLRTLIKWLKRGNIALLILAVLLGFTALTGVVLDIGIVKASAQGTGAAHDTLAAPSGSSSSGSSSSSATGWGLMAAALSTGLAAIGAGIAVAIVGSAAMGAIAERPEIMGRSIIFVGLAEGIAIYGLIISIMILGKI